MAFRRFCRLAVFLAAGGLAFASNFSFSGTSLTDDQQVIFTFTAGGSNVTLRTWSYAGGTNINGQSIAPGGFDPILSLFGPDSTLVASTPGPIGVGTNSGVATDPATGLALDSVLDMTTLSAGQTYFLVLTEVDNSAIGPTYGDGFSEQGNGNFTASMFPCGGSAFCDIGFNQRNGDWAVDIDNATSASNGSVPEPDYTVFSGAALIWGAIIRMLKQRSGLHS